MTKMTNNREAIPILNAHVEKNIWNSDGDYPFPAFCPDYIRFVGEVKQREHISGV